MQKGGGNSTFGRGTQLLEGELNFWQGELNFQSILSILLLALQQSRHHGLLAFQPVPDEGKSRCVDRNTTFILPMLRIVTLIMQIVISISISIIMQKKYATLANEV